MPLETHASYGANVLNLLLPTSAAIFLLVLTLRLHKDLKSELGGGIWNKEAAVAVNTVFAAIFIFFVVWLYSGLSSPAYLPNFISLRLHMFMEISSIVVSMMFFGIVWSSYGIKRQGNIQFLAYALFVAGMIDFAHMLSFEETPGFITRSAEEKAIYFWLFARLIAAVGLLGATVDNLPAPSNKNIRYLFLSLAIVCVAFAYWLGTYIKGEALAEAKIFAEYFIVSLLLLSSYIFYKKRFLIEKNRIFFGFFAATSIGAIGELCFVSYPSATDLSIFTGHLLKIVSYFFIYKTAFAESVRKPFEIMNKEIENRKKTQEEIIKERDFANTLFDTVNGIIAVFDKNGHIVRFSRGAEEITGYDFEEIKGKHFADIFLIPEEAEAVKNVFKNIGGGKIVKRYENHWVMKDGSRRLFDWSNAVIKDKDGDLEYLITVGVDITERVIVEEAFKKSRVTLRTVFNTMNIGINVIDSSGIVTDCNSTSEKLLGIGRKEYLSKNISYKNWLLYKPDGKEVPECEYPAFRAIEYAEPVFGSVVGIKKEGGNMLWLRVDALPLDDGGAIIVFSDITKLKNAEDMQEEQEKLLIQQAKLAAMGEMVGVIAHQWRQPLNVIGYTTMNIGLLHKFGSLGEDRLDDLLCEIDKQTQKMSSIISDFLGFFKPDKTKSFFRISSVFDAVFELVGRQLSSKDIRVVFRSDIEREIFGSKNELEQVVLNIITNAKDAFEGKNITDKEINIGIEEQGHKISIIIRDNAGGIEEEIVDKIFEPYFTTKSEGKGTGIGLYMCRLIAQKSFKGNVEASNIYVNDKRVGAQFLITLNSLVGEGL